MQTKDLIELADDPNLIPGIYNYCDRWCERCPFSSRCLVYISEKEDEDPDPASRDINNAAFWKKITLMILQTQEMITAWAEESGVDLSQDAIAEASAQSDAIRKEARDHPLSKAAEEYARNVQAWFEQAAQETISDTRDVEESKDDIDPAEIIRWYQFFIASKIARGLISRVREEDFPEECKADSSWRDSDGSIKVALIGIDRSITAWRLMGEANWERIDSIRGFVLQLEKLRLSTEREFPNAREFIRPGFDETSIDLVN